MAYKLTYANQGKTRNQPLSDEVVRAYELAARQAAIDEIRVLSGGQPSSGPNRTGSHRHDEGGAGDIQLVKGGNILDFTNPEHLPIIRDWVAAAKASGLTGFGAGEDYMGSSTIHAGGGNPAVWGAKGSGANAPDWLKQAVGTTLTSNPAVAPTAAPTAAPAETPTESDPLSMIAGAFKQEAPEPDVIQSSGMSAGNDASRMAAAQALMAQLLNKNKLSGGLSLTGMT